MRPDLFSTPVLVDRKELRPYQSEGLEKVAAAISEGARRVILQSAVGGGKTLMASRKTEQALEHCDRVLFAAPRVDLISQTIKAFREEGLFDIGALQGDHPETNPSARIQIASAQTLARRDMPKGVGLIIIDECHIVHQNLVKLMASDEWANIPVIGLSATPWTKGLAKIYDRLVVVSTMDSLINQTYLTPLKIWQPPPPDLSGVRTIAGDYQQDELAAAVDRPQIIGDVVRTWEKRGENRPTLVFGVNRRHAEHLRDRFLEIGVPAAYLDCHSDRDERERVFEQFRKGEIRVICNCALLTTGIDLPLASCLIDAHPTKSEMLFVQTIGRVVRRSPGKVDAIILDHAGNVGRLGLPHKIHYEELDDGAPKKDGEREKKEKRDPLPRICPECSFVNAHDVDECEQCGHRFIVRTNVRIVDGELVEFGSDDSGDWNPTTEDKARFYGELKYLSQSKGYKEGWAAHKFKEKFKCWPNDWRVRSAKPVQPSLETIRWIRSRQIAWSRGRAANG